MIKHGPIPPTTLVRPCRNSRLCVNVRHLRAAPRPSLLGSEAFERLHTYVAREGHARVHHRHVEAGYSLGSWVCRIRAAYNEGRLPHKVAAQLEALPRWSWDPYSDNFSEGLSRLHAYVRREGSADLSTTYVEAGFALGQWVSLRRYDRRRGRLSAERIRVLESVPGWTWKATAAAKRRRQQRDDQRFAAKRRTLRAYLGRQGRPRSGSGREANAPLRAWITKLRAAWRQGTLPRSQVKALEALPGWTWDFRQSAFERGLAALRSFVRREGHARVHFQHQEGRFNLGGWVAFKRRDYKYGSLPAAQVRALESVRGWTWYGGPASRDDRFERGLDRLRRFVARMGHAEVPYHHLEGDLGLGTWVARQRQAHRDRRLHAECIAALERVPQWTWEKSPRGRRKRRIG